MMAPLVLYITDGGFPVKRAIFLLEFHLSACHNAGKEQTVFSEEGSWQGERFAGTKIPTFIEFLELLKDYPREDSEWARISADKSIALIEEYGIANGVKLLTCNDPARALRYLQERGLHE